MPSWTTVPGWAVGQLLKRVTLDLSVTAIGELQDWADDADADIIDLQTFSGTLTQRPQLRVFAPASYTSGAVVPYATVRKDTHSGWNTGTYKYTVPVAGLYLVDLQWKVNVAGPTSGIGVTTTGGDLFTAPNAPAVAYGGSGLHGVLDLTASQEIWARELTGSSYTPQNDSIVSPGTGGNYLHVTYLGPTT